MPSYLHSLSSAVPPHAYRQEEIFEVMKGWHGGDRRNERLLRGIYRASAIERRHSVIADFAEGDGDGLYYDRERNEFRVPSTAERNGVYGREAGRLAAAAARRALHRESTDPARITHLVTVSCTGFSAPGPDLELVAQLGLRHEIERYHIGFMGCYGAFPALKLARALTLADPNALVLVVSVELCTLHLQSSADRDSLTAGSVFADGAAAGLVEARSAPGSPAFRIDEFSSSLVTEGQGDMAWTIGDTGFEMVLSGRVPRLVECEVGNALSPLLGRAGVGKEQIDQWAIHPGGRAVLDGVERALSLDADAMRTSREVLAGYGNMSSATVLFILERILGGGSGPGERVAAMAFGPGLSVESTLLTVCGDGTAT